MVYVIKGLQLEEVGSTIDAIEGNFLEKYNMFGYPSARKYTRNVAISATSKFEPSDDFIYEYIVDDKFKLRRVMRHELFHSKQIYSTNKDISNSDFNFNNDDEYERLFDYVCIFAENE